MLTAEEESPGQSVRVTMIIDRVAEAVSLTRAKVNRDQLCSVVQEEPLQIYLGDPQAK
jgi:hypothetical protein